MHANKTPAQLHMRHIVWEWHRKWCQLRVSQHREGLPKTQVRLGGLKEKACARPFPRLARPHLEGWVPAPRRFLNGKALKTSGASQSKGNRSDALKNKIYEGKAMGTFSDSDTRDSSCPSLGPLRANLYSRVKLIRTVWEWGCPNTREWLPLWRVF